MMYNVDFRIEVFFQLARLDQITIKGSLQIPSDRKLGNLVYFQVLLEHVGGIVLI